VPGGADRSYGIEVGRLAGLPAPVIARAKEVLALLEGDAATMAEALGRVPAAGKRSRRRAPPADQLALFASAPPAVAPNVAPNVAPPPPHPVVEALRATDPNHVTPMQALELLARLRAQIHADA